jgi:hypothetical protein
VNVGDQKPMEFPIEYFLTLARNPERWGKDQTEEFTRMWAEREFGPEHADAIAELMTRYTQYNGRRKPELLNAETFSVTNYREAERVEAAWQTLAARAEDVQMRLPKELQDAYFELILYPVKASAIVNEMYIAAGRNHLYAKQGRASANGYGAETRRLFQADATLAAQYNHALANGKWNHMMDQTHIGYTYWQQPPLNAMPAVTEVQPLNGSIMGVAVEGQAQTDGQQVLHFDGPIPQSRFVDIFRRGDKSFHFDVTASDAWIKLSSTGGDTDTDRRVEVNVDTTHAVDHEGSITVAQRDGPSITIPITTSHTQMAVRTEESSFIENDGYVSMEAEHVSHSTGVGEVRWERIPEYGATLSGMSIFPVTAPSIVELQATRPTLEYRMYLYGVGNLKVEAIVGPTLNFVPGRGLRYAISFDDQPARIVDALEHNSDSDWSKVVSDGVRRVDTELNIAAPGYHTLKIGMVDPGLVLEKLVVSKGPLKPSYLGPPESPRSGETASHSFNP